MFFSVDNEDRRHRRPRERRAKELCARCPVIREGRHHARSVGEPFGIWGGPASEPDALMAADPHACALSGVELTTLDDRAIPKLM
jgi:hypothetical protein